MVHIPTDQHPRNGCYFLLFFSEKQFFSGSYQVLLGLLGSSQVLLGFLGSSQVLLRFFSGSSRVLLRFFSAKKKFAQTQFGGVPKIEMDVLQTSNTTPLGIGRFWRVYFTISRFLCFGFFLSTLLHRFGPLRSKIAPGGSQNMSDAKYFFGLYLDATDMYTAQFLARLVKMWWSELKS